MIRDEVMQCIDQEVLYQQVAGKPMQLPFWEWTLTLCYYAEHMEALAVDGRQEEALHELRKLLAVGFTAAYQYGIPERAP